MNKVVEIEILEHYNVWLKFDDGFDSQINFEPFLGKGIAKELLEKDKFRTLHIEPGGGIAWYNGYDFCPNYLRILSQGNKESLKQ